MNLDDSERVVGYPEVILGADLPEDKLPTPEVGSYRTSDVPLLGQYPGCRLSDDR